MERAPLPSPPRADTAEDNDLLMDTPLSPKRPRLDDLPNQVRAGQPARASPRTTNEAHERRTTAVGRRLEPLPPHLPVASRPSPPILARSLTMGV